MHIGVLTLYLGIPQADSLKDLHIKAWENREGS